MHEKKSVLYSILNACCPRCREGVMFPQHTLYTSRFMEMNKKCPCCGQSFEPEPGFYLGVLYTSYALHGVLFLLVLLAVHWLWPQISLVLTAVLLLLAIILFLPVTFRLSRALWIHIFVRYEGPCDEIPKR